jgi:hypothetical protein
MAMWMKDAARSAKGSVRVRRSVALVSLPIIVGALAAFFPQWHWNPTGLAYAAPTRATKAKPAREGFSYTVSDCLGEGHANSVALEQTENVMKFSQIRAMNCIAGTHPETVKVAYAKKGHSLEVTVLLASERTSDCTCPIEIDGRIANLPKGDYRISFVYEEKLGRSEDEKATRTVLGTQEFSVK